MSDRTSVAMEDYQQFEQSLREYLDAHPEVERATAHAPFSAAWHARVRVARQGLSSYSDEPTEAMMFYVIKRLEGHISHLDKLLFSEWRTDRGRKREIASLHHMIREAGKDPDDAPLWRRISEQRKEIKRLNRDNDILRGQLARMEEPNV
ncbi:hypothetical protein [Microbacterium sp. LWH12-1.2]|uniref:hypothetical protein n=1 Tax=Microbacterium sp. LWH12-1.2 TaxID=3135259 RepID=UPI00342297B8